MRFLNGLFMVVRFPYSHPATGSSVAGSSSDHPFPFARLGTNPSLHIPAYPDSSSNTSSCNSSTPSSPAVMVTSGGPTPPHSASIYQVSYCCLIVPTFNLPWAPQLCFTMARSWGILFNESLSGSSRNEGSLRLFLQLLVSPVGPLLVSSTLPFLRIISNLVLEWSMIKQLCLSLSLCAGKPS